MSELRVSRKDLREKEALYGGPRGLDQMIKTRAEFMYNFADYENDRARVRQRLMDEQSKRTTLKDIGEMLDKFIIDERGEGARFIGQAKDDKQPIPSAS